MTPPRQAPSTSGDDQPDDEPLSLDDFAVVDIRDDFGRLVDVEIIEEESPVIGGCRTRVTTTRSSSSAAADGAAMPPPRQAPSTTGSATNRPEQVSGPSRGALQSSAAMPPPRQPPSTTGRPEQVSGPSRGALQSSDAMPPPREAPSTTGSVTGRPEPADSDTDPSSARARRASSPASTYWSGAESVLRAGPRPSGSPLVGDGLSQTPRARSQRQRRASRLRPDRDRLIQHLEQLERSEREERREHQEEHRELMALYNRQAEEAATSNSLFKQAIELFASAVRHHSPPRRRARSRSPLRSLSPQRERAVWSPYRM